MTRSFLFAVAALFILSACQTGGGYSNYNKGWGYKAPKSAPAQQPPKPLSGTGNAQIVDVNAQQISPQTAGPASAPDKTSPQSAKTALPSVKVAILLPLTGQHSSLGKAMLNAAQIAMFDVGHDRFELAPHDTKGTSDGARKAAQAAIREGTQLILGPVFANSVRAAKPAARSAGINMSAFSTDWQLADNSTFIMGFLPFDQIERITSYVATQNLNNIAVIAPQTDYGSAVISAYRALAPRYGLTTTDISSFSPQSNNLAPTMRIFTKYDERIMQARLEAGLPASDQKTKVDLLKHPAPFDAVLMPVGGDLARSVSNLLSHYDLAPSQVKRLGTGLMDDMGLASENSLAGTWFAAPSPRLRAPFESRFVGIYSYQSPRLASLAYDATALAAVLAQRGLQTHGRPMFDRNSISNPNGFAGIDGIFRFRPDGTAERGLAILEYRRGNITIVDDAPTTFQYGVRY